MNLDELRTKRKRLEENSKIVLNNMQKIADESNRVADVAHNSRAILEDIDRQFEKQTGLNKSDFKYLFLATALQLLRIAFINDLTKIEGAGHGNLERELKRRQSEIFATMDKGEMLSAGQYFAPVNQIITTSGVPYDATAYFGENLGILKGANHRFATVGHDPLLGLIFGTANILTNTITCVDQSLLGLGRKGYEVRNVPIGRPLITTNHVRYTEQMVKGSLKFKTPKIAEYGSTLVMLEKSAERINGDAESVVAAIIKQVIHIGTDLYTPCGIQIPGMNLVFSNDLVEKMTSYISTGDVLKVGASAGIAALINLIIGAVHGLTYDENQCESRDLHAVKTRRILLTSNSIATGINVAWVAGNVAYGDKSQVKNLDIGGILVLLNRLMSDPDFIRQIKEDYILGKFNALIQGEPLQLEQIQL